MGWASATGYRHAVFFFPLRDYVLLRVVFPFTTLTLAFRLGYFYHCPQQGLSRSTGGGCDEIPPNIQWESS